MAETKKTINFITLQQVNEKSIEVEGKHFERHVTGCRIAGDIISQFIGNKDREYAVVLLLNTKNYINAIHIVSIGSLNSSMVVPREVFKAAVLNNSASIILGHNHPSGDLNPSKEDISVSLRLKECGRILGIEFLDHVIVNSEDYVSLKDKGII